MLAYGDVRICTADSGAHMAATQYSAFAALTVHATADRVWETLTDLDGATSMLPGLVSIERLGGPEYGVGTRWRETRRMFGTNATEVLEVTAVKPERSTTVHADNRGVIYTTHFSLPPPATSRSSPCISPPRTRIHRRRRASFTRSPRRLPFESRPRP